MLHAQQPGLEDPGGEPGRAGRHERCNAAAHDDSGGASAPVGCVPAGQVNASGGRRHSATHTREQNTDDPPPLQKKAFA